MLEIALEKLKGKVERELTKKAYLWEDVIYQAKKDLQQGNKQETLEAALYFFTEGDDHDIRTFVGLQRAHNIDPAKAAKEIWNNLGLKRQRWIKSLILEAGYQV